MVRAGSIVRQLLVSVMLALAGEHSPGVGRSVSHQLT
jgi:hypothetical protein